MLRLATMIALVLVMTLAATVPAQATTQPAERSDDDLWAELKALSGTQVEDSLWDAAEAATEHVFGKALKRDNGEKIFETLEAAADGDWRHAGQTAGPALLSAYLPGVGKYIELIQGAAQQIDRVTNEWSEQLYDHASYRWVAEQVEAEYRRLRTPLVDVLGDPFYGNVNDDSHAFVPSYALPVGSDAQARARAFEADLFQRWNNQPFMDELTATDYTSNSGGVRGLYTQSYAAMVREVLGYQPEPQRLFNYFYHRVTRQNLKTYVALHEFVEAEHMRRLARQRRQAVIDAYRTALAGRNRPQPYLVMACDAASAFQPGFDGKMVEDEGNRKIREFRSQMYQAAEQNGVNAAAIEAHISSNVSPGLITDVAFNFDLADLEERPVGTRFDADVALHLTPDVLGVIWSGKPDSFAGALRTSHLALGKAFLDVGPDLLLTRFSNATAVGRFEDSEAPLVIRLSGLDYQYAHRFTPRRGIYARMGAGVQVCFEGQTIVDTTIRTEEYFVRPNDNSFNSSRAMGISTMEGVSLILSEVADRVAAHPYPRLATYLKGEEPRDLLTGEAAERSAQINPRPQRVTSGRPETPRSTVERMRELQELRDSSMISATEFERLRGEMLKTLTQGD